MLLMRIGIGPSTVLQQALQQNLFTLGRSRNCHNLQVFFVDACLFSGILKLKARHVGESVT